MYECTYIYKYTYIYKCNIYIYIYKINENTYIYIYKKSCIMCPSELPESHCGFRDSIYITSVLVL